jgi:hypothetical protein
VYYNSNFKRYIHSLTIIAFLGIQSNMEGRKLSSETHLDTTQTRSFTPKLEINNSPISKLHLLDP